MMDGLTPTLLVTVGAGFLAGLARGFSGFGAALIFMPVATATVGAAVAAPVLLVVDGVLTLPLIPGAMRRCQGRDVLAVVTGALVGVPLGTLVLARSDPAALRWGVAVVVLALLAFLVSGWRMAPQPVGPRSIGVGLAAGVLSGAAQMGGPPVVAYWLGSDRPPSAVRANVITYFAFSTLIAAVTYSLGGLWTVEVLRLALAVAPIYALGLWLGARMFGLADDETFRRVCFALIAVAGFGSLPILDWLWQGLG